VVLKIGRPSAREPVGLIGLILVTTGRSLPFAYITPTDAERSWPNARSNCALVCHVWPATKFGSTAHGDWGLSVPVVTPLGNAGAPAAVPLNV